MNDAASLATALEKYLPAAIEFLRQMVGINSYTTNRGGVECVAMLTARQFEPLGFTAETVPSTNPDFAGHLVLTRRGKGKHNLALISHLDTVFPPEEEERNNFHWQPEGDRIFGPGTQDIKGGTAMIWLMLSAMAAAAPKIFDAVTWKLLWNSSEECFSPDFGDVCRARFDEHTLGALIFEAEGRLGRDHLLVLARKGRASWRVKVSGRGAHAGGKHSYGANAILQAGLLAQKLENLTDYSKELTFNVATVSGGTVLNRVPHEAVLEGEFRAFKPEVYQAAKQSLLDLAGPGEVRSRADKFPCAIAVEILTESRPWPRNPASDNLFEFWTQAAAELNIPVGFEERGGLSDGNLIWDAVPTLDGLGPWGDNDHCSERSADGSKLPEYVEISSFLPKAMLNCAAVGGLVRS